jgi:serine/threonine protein kinase
LSYRVAGEEIVEGDSRYMAPELLQELDEFGNMPDLTKADIFSLGATIFEIMTGTL